MNMARSGVLLFGINAALAGPNFMMGHYVLGSLNCVATIIIYVVLWVNYLATAIDRQ